MIVLTVHPDAGNRMPFVAAPSSVKATEHAETHAVSFCLLLSGCKSVPRKSGGGSMRLPHLQYLEGFLQPVPETLQFIPHIHLLERKKKKREKKK